MLIHYIHKLWMMNKKLLFVLILISVLVVFLLKPSRSYRLAVGGEIGLLSIDGDTSVTGDSAQTVPLVPRQSSPLIPH